MKLFVNYYGKRNSIEYWDSVHDSKKRWRANCAKEGPNWYYYESDERKISYIRNEFGFRDKPISDYDWSNSIVIIGCSVVEGIGNTIEDTIGKNLEKILDIPVLNFGISGSGIDLASINSLILHNNYPTPKAVVQLWSGILRYSDFVGKDDLVNYMPQRSNYDPRYNWENRNRYYVEADRALWKNKTLYYEGSIFEDTAQALSIKYYPLEDRARDSDHPGYKTNKIIAEDIANNLKLQGI